LLIVNCFNEEIEKSMINIPEQAQKEVNERIDGSTKERKHTQDCLNNGQLMSADTPERIEQRKVQLLANHGLTTLLGEKNRHDLASGLVSAAPEEAQRAFEKTIDDLNTQPCWFLTRGSELRRTIGRVHIRDSIRRVGWGTGFLVAPNLLLTNQHVLDSLETARNSRVEFDFEETFTGEILPSAIFDLDPSTFFVSSPAIGGMDYALVAVSSRARPDSNWATANLAEFGYNILIRETGKILKGELIHCIHHPEGQPRQVTLRENKLVALQDPALEDVWMHYETDTEGGSSGAPLFNNQWQVVGIHHAGVEKRDNAGNILAIGGDRWKPSMGERLKWWYANEGLRISRFIKDAETQVEAAVNSTLPVFAERIVTDTGHQLFKAMLQTTQNTVTPSTPVRETDSSSPPANSEPRFIPD
jgi:endonuclease G, mitochondrial